MNTKFIKKLCLGAATVALIGFSSPQVTTAQEVTLMTLRDAVAIGVATNPEYGVVAASRRATDEELEQGRSLFLPSVDFNFDYGVEHTDDQTTRANGDDENLWRYETGLTLTQLLFDGWDSHFEVERQKARVKSSAFRVEETYELVGLSIVESYLEVLRQRQLVLISRENVSAHENIMSLIQDGVSAGRSTQADIEQARARLASAKANEANAVQNLINAESSFRREVGDAPGQLKMPETPYGGLAPDVEQEVLISLTNSPTLDIFESDIEVAYAEAEQTKSTFYPQVDLQLNARQGHDIQGVQGRDRSATGLVVMNWNLYRGGGDTARAHEFVHRHQQAKESRADAARTLENDVRQTWASMVAAGERARQFAAQADANVEVVRSYKDQFSLDRRTLLDVLDAQNELFVSRSNTVNAEFVELLAVYRLHALKGQLIPALSISYPRESVVSSRDTSSETELVKAR